MRIVILYESSYGNTHLIASAIGEGFGSGHDVDVVAVAGAGPELLDSADLVVVGGPTHVHGISSEKSRQAAAAAAAQPGSPLEMDPDAEGPGLREWFASLAPVDGRAAAAFDTRLDANVHVTGRASKGIGRRLRHHGFREIADGMSFLVTKGNHLAPGQEAEARQWGQLLAGVMVARVATTASGET